MQGEGERLSHAVGCAFSACLEAKKQRDALCSVEATFHGKSKSVFEKQGTFRDTKTASTEGATKSEAVSKRVYGVVKNPIPEDEEWSEDADSVACKQEKAAPESAIERKRAPAAMLERMQSMKEFSKINSNLPFSERSKSVNNKSLQLRTSMSVTDELSRESRKQSHTFVKQQSLCIDDSVHTNRPNVSLTHNQAPNAFEDSFAASSRIPNSMSVPSFNNNCASVSLNKVQQPPQNDSSNQTQVELHQSHPNSSSVQEKSSELSSTNPFFIFVSSPENRQATQIMSNQESWTSNDTKPQWPAMRNEESYSKTNPFGDNSYRL